MATTPEDRRPSDGLTHNPFAALRSDGRPAPAPPEELRPEPRTGGAGEPAALGRVVVRREKRGRGGKTVTRVAGLGLEPQGLEELARELRRALGCGASREEADLLLQGDQEARAAAWLRERRGAEVVEGTRKR